MGIESAVDSTGGEHPHGDEYVHVLDSGDPLSMDSHDDDGHCSHCCHGHAGSIVGDVPAWKRDMTEQQFEFYHTYFLN